MRTASLALALFALLAALAFASPAAPAQTGTPAAPLTRCDAAMRLARASVDDVANRELEKILKIDAERACAEEGLRNQNAKAALKALAAKASAAPELSACEAGADLQAAGVDDEAKTQFQKAAEENATRQCGVDGLKALHADQEGTSWDEVQDVLRGWAKTAWPWAVAGAFLWLGMLLWRLLGSAGDIRVIPKGGDAKLGARVVAAANATGSGGRPPTKLISGEEQGLDGGAVASLTKLLRVPAGVPIDALLTVATWPLRWQRLKVGYSEGGGWAVLDVTLHRLLKSKRHARLAVQLERETTEARQEVLSLVAGAWLATLLIADRPGAPVKEGDWEAVIAHAYFRAGANLQDRAEPDRALACYAAMDRIVREDGSQYILGMEQAPAAWFGARLNQMMSLKDQGRVREALALAEVAGDVPDSLLAGASADWFGQRQLNDLKRRAHYLRAILYEDLAWEEPTPDLPPDLPEKATKAAIVLEGEVEALEETDPTNALRRPMRLVLACHRIRAPETALSDPPLPITDDTIRRILGDAVRHAARAGVAPPLTAAAFYDAACALALLPDPTPERREEALRYIKCAVAACAVSSRPRVRAAVADDPMLVKLKPLGTGSLDKYEKDLAEALGSDADDAPKKEKDEKQAA